MVPGSFPSTMSPTPRRASTGTSPSEKGRVPSIQNSQRTTSDESVISDTSGASTPRMGILKVHGRNRSNSLPPCILQKNLPPIAKISSGRRNSVTFIEHRLSPDNEEPHPVEVEKIPFPVGSDIFRQVLSDVCVEEEHDVIREEEEEEDVCSCHSEQASRRRVRWGDPTSVSSTTRKKSSLTQIFHA